jgi:acetoin utilization protein AcuC
MRSCGSAGISHVRPVRRRAIVPAVSLHGPLLVFGPRSINYDLGPSHPLTPRRFGPGIELLESVGAKRRLAPEPASDEILEWVHDPGYVATVRALSADPFGRPTAGLGPGDTPAFAGMHEAAAAVAGGSVAAMEAILRGDVEHAFHPGGGLHHAMPGRASGFCVYNDPALAVARARRDGWRVLYIDLDVHHGDGVQVIHWNDPGVMTFSIHESGDTLFPGTGFVDERGGPAALGTKVNVPLVAGTGERGWLGAVQRLLPALASSFKPDVIVSQHGADAHAFDPLARLNVTTTAMGAAARLVDEIAHRWAGGRWLATGGGGYDVYRVVPRAWALVWLAGAHREGPSALPGDWRARWAADADRYGQAPVPSTLEDPPNAGLPYGPREQAADDRALALAEVLLRSVAAGGVASG